MEKTQASDRGNFKLNMDFLHNKVLENFVNGDGLMVNAADTIETDELREEFGKYVANVKYDIITLLFGKLQATQYMTTKMTEKTVWRAIQSHISDLMQKFTRTGLLPVNPSLPRSRFRITNTRSTCRLSPRRSWRT